jgi:hypothetical protein
LRDGHHLDGSHRQPSRSLHQTSTSLADDFFGALSETSPHGPIMERISVFSVAISCACLFD